LKEGVALSAIGAALGLGGALLAVRLLSSTLIGVSPSDPPTYAAAGALQIVVAMAACMMPAVRAMRSDPMVALRQE